MDVLIDTHVLIWFTEDDAQLPAELTSLLNDRKTRVHISMATFWEMGIKFSIGKLAIKRSLDQIYEFIAQRIIVPIEFRDVQLITRLPMHHRDPFDRMRIAQAMNRNLTIISKDAAFDLYDVKRLW